MGDFLLDCRPSVSRQMDRAAAFLQFFPDMPLERWEEPEFSLLLTSADQPRLWSSFRSADTGIQVALCGRLSLDERDWQEAEHVTGAGGLACRHVYRLYRQGGIEKLGELSGNFAIVVFDRPAGRLFLLTDPWGLMPAFRWETGAAAVLGSHPDALADAVGESRNWDVTSFAEFILTGRLSAPFTYYRRIQALPCGSLVTIPLASGAVSGGSTRDFFPFKYDPQPEAQFERLADELAAGFRQAVGRRTAPLLGRSAIGLSGGLDSRALLCATPRRENLVTFCCYDEENLEFRLARSIAKVTGTPFVPLQRSADYYADHAELGVRISGGTGCLASNHFLGFRHQLRELGVDNLLTGCYCDYVFKGLALNKRVNRWTCRESLGRFEASYYAAHVPAKTEVARLVARRLDDLFPPDLRRYDSEPCVAAVENRRMFPLCYEEDNAQRTIPQRVMGWPVPIAEQALLKVHLQMSSAMKLNRRLFARMMEKVCPADVLRIPDANTGAPVTAGPIRQAASAHLRRLKGHLEKMKPSRATSGSWLNWTFFVNHNPKIRELWSSPNRDADAVFQEVLGAEGFNRDLQSYRGPRLYIFLQLLTLKLWFDQRNR